MAFRFSWPDFDQEFYVEAKSQLETALNKGNKPSVIVDHITVKELDMGTKPPELEILEIGELGNDKFRGIFKLNYAGDAYIEVQTKVQANPMHAKTSELPRHSRPGILAADQPLVVPMILRISDLKLRGIVVLVVSKTKGVTLVFKNDPLESIRISSTFDSVSILRDFLQRQIETQLRKMLQDDLPVMIHNLSLRYIQSEEEKKRKKEQEERLQQLAQQQKSRSGSVYSEPAFNGLYGRKSFHTQPGTPMTAPMRLRSWTNSTDYSSLPELDCSPFSPLSPSSLISTPINGEFDLGDTYYNYDKYISCSPTSTVFDYSDIDSCNNDCKKVDSTMSLLEKRLENLSVHNNGNDYFHCRPVPITVANLFKHNRGMNQLGISVRNDYHPMNNFIYQNLESSSQVALQQHDLMSEAGLSTATTPCLSMSDVYADDADAPWYALEGPELFSMAPPALSTNMLLMEEKNILLDTTENTMAQKLSQLMTVNYTLSPLTETIPHFTFRSLPYVKKSTNTSARHKKVPKRRITKLSMSIPRL